MGSPSSTVVLCPVLSDPPNGLVVLSDSNFVDSRAGYSCNSGFRFQEGDAILRVCMQSGEWGGSEPRCICKFQHVCVFTASDAPV